MPWCPICNTEFIESVETCPECEVPLRPAPGLDELMFEDRSWTVIREASNSMEAEIIKDFFEERGIEVRVLDRESILTFFLPIAGPGSTCRIMVPTESSYDAVLALRAQKGWTDDELTRYMEEHGGMKDGDSGDYLDEEKPPSEK